MKSLIVLCCVFALGACVSTAMKKREMSGDFVDMVKRWKYPVESYDVETEDGYILEMFRISHGRENEQTFPSPSSSESSESERKVIFLMHGLATNAESFVYGGPCESLALHLADAGYDVFLGNARGTTYGQRHTKLNPKTDAAFWRYSWHEIGVRDLPAMIKKALSVSGQDDLMFIGHNEGTTAFYVWASEMPEMSSKVERHISLGPLVFMQNSTNDVLQSITDHLKQRSWLIKNLGVNTFNPSDELIHDAYNNCMGKMNKEELCRNVYFLINGWNSEHMNMTTFNQFKSRVPSTASVREILHLVQLKATGRFEQYSDGSGGKKYDLSKVNIPVALIYTPSDSLSSMEDMQTLIKELSNVYLEIKMEDLDNNLDLLYSEKMEQVMEKVMQALKQKVQKNQ